MNIMTKPRGFEFARRLALCVTAALALSGISAASAQTDTAYTPEELQELVGPIALYPDDLVAIVLPASTYPVQIVQAARLLDDLEDNPALEPDPEWDNAVVALLNYPEVVHMMNDDLDWTWELGEAVLNSQANVIDAIQVFRDRAYAAGNLRSDERQVIAQENGVYSIAPADPEVIYVPYYEPERVVVYQRSPVYYYYADPYPLYYYPYPVGYSFRSGFFWGVTSAFSIGWHSHYLHVYHHSHVGHPYYRRSYYTPYYARRGVNININLNQQSHIWQPTHRRGDRPDPGYRPGTRRTYTREGYSDRGSASARAEARTGRVTQRSSAAGATARRGSSAAGTIQRSTDRSATARTRGDAAVDRNAAIVQGRRGIGRVNDGDTARQSRIAGQSARQPQRAAPTRAEELQPGAATSTRQVERATPTRKRLAQPEARLGTRQIQPAVPAQQRAPAEASAANRGRVFNPGGQARASNLTAQPPATFRAPVQTRDQARPRTRAAAPAPVQSNPAPTARANRSEPRQPAAQSPRARQAQSNSNRGGRRAR
jgi:hypothetical protein